MSKIYVNELENWSYVDLGSKENSTGIYIMPGHTANKFKPLLLGKWSFVDESGKLFDVELSSVENVETVSGSNISEIIFVKINGLKTSRAHFAEMDAFFKGETYD